MKIKITSRFREKLSKQIQYIAADKRYAARKFNKSVFSQIRNIGDMPYKNRQSIFFEDKNIRDLIVKGYIIVYEILPSEQLIVIFGLYKWEEDLKG